MPLHSGPKRDLQERLAGLSAARQAYLAHLLNGEVFAVEQARIMPRDSNEGQVLLSYAQQRLWFLDQLEPERVAYNVPTAIRLGPLDIGALEQSLNALVARHEVL